MIINYKGKEIELDYSEEISERIIHPFRARGFSVGEYGDYLLIEHDAQLYMIDYASKKKSECNIEKFVGTRQTVSQVSFNGKPGIKITVSGIAAYKKINLYTKILK